MVVVVEIAVHAALVAAVGDVEVHAEGNSELQGALVHLLHQGHAASPMGRSETSRIPCFESSSTNCSASERATPGSTSNWLHTLRSMISERGVRPSAACHIAVAT